MSVLHLHIATHIQSLEGLPLQLRPMFFSQTVTTQPTLATWVTYLTAVVICIATPDSVTPFNSSRSSLYNPSNQANFLSYYHHKIPQRHRLKGTCCYKEK